MRRTVVSLAAGAGNGCRRWGGSDSDGWRDQRQRSGVLN